MSESIIELEKKLANVLANSRANEAITQKLFDIETQILSCKSSQEFLQQLLSSIKDKFNLEGICLFYIKKQLRLSKNNRAYRRN